MPETKPSGMQFRELKFDAKPDLESRSFTIPVSSESPVERWWGTEILDHSPETIDMARLQDGAPLLLDHDPTRQIGVIEGASLGADKRLNATVRFSRSSLGEEVFQDVLDGIRRNVSIGYRINDLKEEAEGIYRAAFSPMEISVVSVPADAGVGFGRSDDRTFNPLDLLTQRSTAMSDPIEETPVEETAPVLPAEPTEAPVDVAEVVRSALEVERKRNAGIRETVRMAKLDESIAEKLIDSGKPLDDCRAEVLRMWSEKVDSSATDSGRSDDEVAHQTRSADLAKSILNQVAGVK
jgi:hypothetical protein